ncbi:MAG: hypothetical protein EBU33_06780 [Sphingobacteriia bacterium]|nr:hypothetical protein [Sphingobacteriia bacterium]
MNKIEAVMHALTLADRPWKRDQWLARGFAKIHARPGALLSYWTKRLAVAAPSDVAMFERFWGIYESAEKPLTAAIESQKTDVVGLVDVRRISDEEIKGRAEICKQCEFFDPLALRGNGKCMKCNCNPALKIKISDEECPVGKWRKA